MQCILAVIRMEHLYAALLESTNEAFDPLLIARNSFRAKDDGIPLIKTQLGVAIHGEAVKR